MCAIFFPFIHFARAKFQKCAKLSPIFIKNQSKSLPILTFSRSNFCKIKITQKIKNCKLKSEKKRKKRKKRESEKGPSTRDSFLCSSAALVQ
jgi:hypothetical protein